MLTTLALAALLATQPGETSAPVQFDTLTLKAAEALDGQRVTITFVPARPAYTWGEGKELVTIAAPADTAAFNRTVTLKGNRLRDADVGRTRLKVHGMLRVIRHPSVVIGEQTFAPYTEVRVEE